MLGGILLRTLSNACKCVQVSVAYLITLDPEMLLSRSWHEFFFQVENMNITVTSSEQGDSGHRRRDRYGNSYRKK